jgi:hypothetical protein
MRRSKDAVGFLGILGGLGRGGGVPGPNPTPAHAAIRTAAMSPRAIELMNTDSTRGSLGASARAGLALGGCFGLQLLESAACRMW